MKRLILAFLLFLLYGCSKDTSIKIQHQPLAHHSFQEVWKEVASDPYKTLPQESISFGKLFTFSKNIILHDAKRTLSERSDIRKPFDKLAHPNGICLKGVWRITEASPYSGYFKKGTHASIIARASSAMSNTKRGEIRSFGFAGKIFPNKKKNTGYTANFFLIDDLGGTDAAHYTDVALSNAPQVSTTSEVLKNLLYALKVASAFKDADVHPNIRQLYEVSELDEKVKSRSITPKWMKISAQKGQAVDAEDFRDEFIMTKGHKMVFNIFVTSKEKNGQKEWHKIGAITFDAAIASMSCDHRLHFHHPVWRDDIKYYEKDYSTVDTSFN